MKYNQFLLLLLPVICSCSQDKTMDKLTQTDSLLDRLETDSVKKMLCGIDTLNTSQESKAYYKLLYSQYQYIVDDNFQDTTLLNDCIRFYEKKSDKEKLARSIIKVNAVSETKTYKKLFSMKNMLSTY